MSTWGRTISNNDDCTIPGTIVCVEIATVATPDATNPRQRIHRLRCGHALAGRMENGKWTREKVLRFTSASDLYPFLNFARQSGKPCWMLSQNLSLSLTLTRFWSLLESGEFKLLQPPAKNLERIKSPRLRERLSRQRPGLLIEADPPTALLCWHREGWKLICLDTRNYWDKSPPTLAESATLPLMSTPTDDDRPEAWQLYCEQLCRVTQQCVARLAGWHKQQNQGHWAFTVSGMALAAFRHKYLYHAVQCPAEQDDRDFERRAYYNGRCEPFWLGEIRDRRFYPIDGNRKPPTLTEPVPRGPFHLLDARSFYGAVATFQSVPVKCEAEGDGWPPGDIFPKRLDENYLAEVLIDSDRHEFPIRLPDRTVFALGRFWTVLAGPEINRAVSSGCVKAVGHWRRYELETVLRQYALGIWQDRQNAESAGDKLLAGLCKSLLARLHGKFLQRDTRWVVCKDVTCPGPWRRWSKIVQATGTVEHYRSVGNEVQRQQPAGDMRHCFPAIAAYVTAWGREYLRHWMKLAGQGHVLYCSTDSLIVDDEGRGNLERAGIIGSNEIGSLRVVHSSDHLAIYGANNFEIGDRICLAGLPSNSKRRSRFVAEYSTYTSLAGTIGRRPAESVTETCQVAQLKAQECGQRLTPGGWLDRIVLSQEETTWKSAPITSPT